MGVALNGKDDLRMLRSALMIGVFGVLTLVKARRGSVLVAAPRKPLRLQVFTVFRRLCPTVYIKEANDCRKC